jgi:glycolate oxidase FAD binding subunit
LPAANLTVQLALDKEQALARFAQWTPTPLPIAATVWADNVLTVRMQGAESVLRAAQAQIGGELMSDGSAQIFWDAQRDQRLPLFEKNLARVCCLASTPIPSFHTLPMLEWHGACRWYPLEDAQDLERLRALYPQAQVCRYRHADATIPNFAPLPTRVLALHMALKNKFDPQGIFNPKRLYAEF